MTSDYLGESAEMVDECQHCDYMSQDLSNYKQHLEGLHTGTVYKCKIFCTTSKLNVHFCNLNGTVRSK